MKTTIYFAKSVSQYLLFILIIIIDLIQIFWRMLCFNSNVFNLYIFYTNVNIRYLYVLRWYFNIQNISIKNPFWFLPKNNFFVLQKVFVVNNFAKVYLQKNSAYATTTALTKAVVVVSRFFRVDDYRRLFVFFLKNFAKKKKMFFFSFKLFFFDFLNFMGFIFGSGFYILYKPLFYFYQEKQNRKKFKKLLKFIFKRFKPKVAVLFDYKYSSYFFKLVRSTRALRVGFTYFDTWKTKFHMELFLGHRDVLIKYLIFQQIFDIYTLAISFRCEVFAKRFLWEIDFYRLN